MCLLVKSLCKCWKNEFICINSCINTSNTSVWGVLVVLVHFECEINCCA